MVFLETEHPVAVRTGAASSVSRQEGSTQVVREKVKLVEMGSPKMERPGPSQTRPLNLRP